MAEPVDSELLRQIAVPVAGSDTRGVACLIGSDLALTMNHLVGARSSVELDVDGQLRRAQVELVDEATEIALLRFDPPLSRAIPATFSSTPWSPDEARFVTLGFEHGPRMPVLIGGSVVGLVTRDGRFLIQIAIENGEPFRGLSGAPVVVGRRVVGLIDSGLANIAGELSATLFVAPFSAAKAIAARVSTAVPADIFTRLSPSALRALENAEGLRRALNQSKLHMEHLLAGLQQKPSGPAERAFVSAGLDAAALRALVSEVAKIDLPISAPPRSLTGLPPLSAHALQAVSAAQNLSTDGTIHSRDLFAGAMSVTDCRLVRELLDRGVSATASPAIAPWRETRESTRGMGSTVRRPAARHPAPVRDDDEAISGGLESLAAPASGASAAAKADTYHPSQSVSETERAAPTSRIDRGGEVAALAGFRSDGVVGQTDLLDIKRDVEALASVIAARDVDPPLSIGLFGDWGSGKSFFIEEMRKKISALAKAARDAEDRAEEASRPRMEATGYCARIAQLEFNAWRYIDTELWASLTDGILDGLARAMQDPDQVETGEAERARLFAAAARSRDVIGEAEARRSTAAENLLRQQERLDRAVERATRRTGEAALKLEATALVITANESLRSELDEVGKTLHTDVATSEARAVLLDLKGTWGLLRAFGRAVRAQSGWFVAGLAAFAVLSGVLAAFHDQLDHAVRYLVGTGWIASIAAACLPYVRRAGSAVRQVSKIVDAHEQALTRAVEQMTDEDRRKRDEARRAVDIEEKKLADARGELQRVDKQLLELRADKQMAEFVKARQGSDDYRKHFGVIGRARADFEELSNLLLRAKGEAPHPGLPRIDRIVLYIDDLDRCQEEQVVKVLQAVHLLLAFKLFVVVVAVDSRWLLHSLQQQSKAFRSKIDGDDGISDDERLHWQSTPLNYLEKIFQVPFTLKPVGEGGFGNMIDYLSRPLSEIRKPDAMSSSSAPTRDDGTNASTPPPTNHTATPITSSSPAPVLASRAPLSPQNAITGAATSRGLSSSKELDMTITSGQPAAAEPIDVNPPHLVIEPWEQAFMKQFHEMIPTPRAIKRFVNVYRLLKARVPKDRERVFRGDATNGEHRAALFLLALLIGYPSEATDLMRDLCEASATGPWWDWIEAAIADQLHVVVEKSPQRERLEDLASRLGGLRKRFGTAIDLPTVEVFAYWTPLVARFSFQAGRVGNSTISGIGAKPAPPITKSTALRPQPS